MCYELEVDGCMPCGLDGILATACYWHTYWYVMFMLETKKRNMVAIFSLLFLFEQIRVFLIVMFGLFSLYINLNKEIENNV